MKILDSGYLRLIEVWGSDQRIVEAARMSTQKGFLGWGPFHECKHCKERFQLEEGQRDCPKCGLGPVFTVRGDERLLDYLWTNHHATPFEMAGAVFEVKAPIMVFREWHRFVIGIA